jgi:hypothetical protein
MAVKPAERAGIVYGKLLYLIYFCFLTASLHASPSNFILLRGELFAVPRGGGDMAAVCHRPYYKKVPLVARDVLHSFSFLVSLYSQEIGFDS